MTIQIMIVDDCAIVRTELRNVLELSGSVTVAGEAVDGCDALRQAEILKPDIVLMDLEMPGMDGYEATLRLKATHPAPAVIIFTVYDCPFNQQRAVESGADAFIIKGTDLNTILNLFEHFSQREV